MQALSLVLLSMLVREVGKVMMLRWHSRCGGRRQRILEPGTLVTRLLSALFLCLSPLPHSLLCLPLAILPIPQTKIKQVTLE